MYLLEEEEEEEEMEIQEVSSCQALPLLSVNHVSLVVRCVWTSAKFYEDVLGFVLVKRPSSFNFRGAWLYNYGIGIHLLEKESTDDEHESTWNESRPINPKENHISFQCTDVNLVKWRLEDMGMKYVTATVEDEGIKVDQVFFHDPDGYMIEICNCDNLPMLPISACPLMKPKLDCSIKNTGMTKCGVFEHIMASLSMDLMNFSF